jgi:hypothetical protein
VSAIDYDKRLEHMLGLAEKRFGARTHNRALKPVSFHSGVPQVFYPTPTELAIRIGLRCETDYVRGCYQLAHEAIHVLSPVDYGNTTMLEEGLATSFAHEYIRDHVGTDWSHSGDARYDAARALVECFLTPRPDAVSHLRKQQPVISSIKADMIRQAYPDIPRAVCDQLTTLFPVPPTA